MFCQFFLIQTFISIGSLLHTLYLNWPFSVHSPNRPWETNPDFLATHRCNAIIDYLYQIKAKNHDFQKKEKRKLQTGADPFHSIINWKLNASLLLDLFIRSSCPFRKGNDPADPLMFRPWPIVSQIPVNNTHHKTTTITEHLKNGWLSSIYYHEHMEQVHGQFIWKSRWGIVIHEAYLL